MLDSPSQVGDDIEKNEVLGFQKLQDVVCNSTSLEQHVTLNKIHLFRLY